MALNVFLLVDVAGVMEADEVVAGLLQDSGPQCLTRRATRDGDSQRVGK
jgi:hypothetical protein